MTTLDLDPESLRALEFDAVLAWVASFARSGPGRRSVLGRAPLAELDAARRDLAAAGELGRHLGAEGRLVPDGIPDPEPGLAALEVAGLVLEPKVLLALARTASAIGALRAGLGRLPESDYPWLRAQGRSLAPAPAECARIEAGIGPDGRIRDQASAELERLRRAAGRAAAHLADVLERLVRDPERGAVVQDEFFTRRNGRFVVPVRSDAPRPLRGIVHASSSSGATRFVEPLETVELNNELVQLEEQEQEEERRLLAQWSDALRGQRAELAGASRCLGEIDDAQARALFAEACGAASPELASGGPIVLDGARHPLLERRLRERHESCVPLDLTLDPGDRVLVLSGPNAGGKSVALKTLGLFALMAQSGIPVPARQARLPLYRQVRVDIGDRQSIQADLSTFSAHVRAVAAFLRDAAPPALFLFDEIGSGTEPGEGAALARAVLESLVGRGITAVATTHLGDVKAWAIGSGQAVSAAMEFDDERMLPTFRVRMGSAGTSAGLAIALRAGLEPALVERARGHLAPEARRREDYLARLQRLLAETDSEKQALTAERERSATLRREQAEREERERRRAAERVERAIAELRERGRRELAAVGEQARRRRVEKKWSQAVAALRSDAVRAAHVTEHAVEADAGEAPLRVAPGEAVHLRSVGRDGEITEVRGERVRVRVGEVVIDAARSDLCSPRAPRAAPPARRGAVTEADRSGGAGPELLLLGKTAEEAVAELDKFLDSALRAGYEEVRVVHGHGSGRLRRAVRGFLDDHPLVAGHRPGRPEEGGDGATIVTLA